MKDLIKAAKDIEKTMEGLSEASSRQTQTFNNHFKQTMSIMGDYAKQMQDSNKVIMGAARSYAEMEKNQKRIGKMQKKHYNDIVAIETKIREIRNDGKEDGIALDQDAAEKRIEQLNYEMTLQMKQAKRVHDYEAGLLQERATERESRYKEFQELTKNHRKKMQKMGAFGKDMGSKARGGDISGIASGGLDSVGAILKQLGGVGGKLGMVATALGATVGLLGVFVALMFEADKKAKDMNKNFLAGASGLDLMGKNFKKGQLTKRLFDMREMAFDVGMQFRMSADDVATLASSFNQFGLRYDEMASMVRGTDDPIRALEQNLTVAITKSKMLGVEANTVAEQIAQMNENFAMDLSQIEDAFSAIYMSAQTTGIATQKFFAMITQVTGGMSLLNVDFAQTAAIAGELVESLGEAAGSKFLQDLANRGRSKSYQDRAKSALLSGTKTSRISKKAVSARAKRVQDSDAFRSVTGSKGFQDQMALLGIDFDPSKDLMESLGSMNQKQQRSMIATMGNKTFGGDPAVERQMRELVKLQGTTGKGGLMNRTVQMGMFNTGENLAQMLAEASRFADLEKGESLGGMDRMVLEQITGRSGGDLDEFVTMVDKLQTNMSVVSDYGEQVKSQGMAATAEAAGFDNVEDFKKMLAEEYKLALNDQGEMMSSETGEIVKSVEDYAIHMGDSMKGSVEEAMSIENAMTSEIVTNTASASAILENVIAKHLNKISGFVEGIYSWIFGGTEVDKTQTEKKQDEISTALEELYTKKQSAQKVLSELGTDVKTGKASAKDKARYEVAQQTVTESSAAIRSREEQRRILSRGGYAASRSKLRGLEREDQAERSRRLQKRIEEKRASFDPKDVAAKEKAEADAQKMLEDEARRRLAAYSQQMATGINASAEEREDLGAKNQFRLTPLGEGQTYDFTDEAMKGSGNIEEFASFMQVMKPLFDAGMSLEQIKALSAGGAGIKENSTGLAYNSLFGMMGEKGMSITEAALGIPAFNKPERVGLSVSSAEERLVGSTSSGDELEVLNELTDSQYEAQQKANELSIDGQASLDSMVTSFSTLGKDTDEMKKFQEKGLPPAIGKEVMKAMVAEKLFDIAGASGMSLEDILEAQRTQNDGNPNNDIHVGSKIDAEIAKLEAEENGTTKNADRIAELAKQKANLKTLGLKDAAYIDGKMYPEGEGAIITTPDGTSYQTKGDDNMLIGTKVGKGGGGAGQTIIMNVDKVVTTARNGAELADSLMKEMKRNPNTKKRIRRSKN